MDDFETNLVEKMKAQADAIPDGWIELEVPFCDETNAPAFSVKLPRIPFERWARHTYQHRLNEWMAVCPSGVKMMGDDRNHSDWWLGTGIPLEYAYGREPLSSKRNSWFEPGDPEWVEPDPRMNEFIALAQRITQAAWDYRFNSTSNRTRNSIFLVSSQKKLEGLIVHVRGPEDIQHAVNVATRWHKAYNKQHVFAVVPNCSVTYDPVIRHCDAIITEVGSAAAHLVKVAREDRIPVIMCPDAFKEYFDGERIKIENKQILSKH